MQISEHIRDKVSVDYFFIKGKIDLDADYFINKIKESCQSKDNMNYKTNIQSLMTPFQFFSKDPNFLQILKNFIELIDSNYDFVRYCVSRYYHFSTNSSKLKLIPNLEILSLFGSQPCIKKGLNSAKTPLSGLIDLLISGNFNS